ncbi:MAG TPA: nucleotidyl transferase AbiEii/AbiGii toxin family protein [Anaerolineales bacterium]
MKFHLEGLSGKQIQILRKFGKEFDRRGFYLGGGTALAVYFGHRLSADLDWFTSNPIDDALLLAESLRRSGLDFTTTQSAPGTLHGTLMGVRVSFLEYRYPLLQVPTIWKEMGCSLASLDDLACMKLSAVAGRGARKDFCDIYVLGTKHRSLPELIRLYQQKFKMDDISPVLYGLSYFDDAESERMPRMLLNVPWRTIKKKIQEWIKGIAQF